MCDTVNQQFGSRTAAMDPVSRRLVAAAMGLAFGLSRDEELEKTRLDLERARMEREDFRNGGGPDTAFIHRDPHWNARYGVSKEIHRKEYERVYKYMMRPHLEYQDTARKELKRSRQMCDVLQEDLEVAVASLKRIVVSGNSEAADEATSALTAMGYNEETSADSDGSEEE